MLKVISNQAKIVRRKIIIMLQVWVNAQTQTVEYEEYKHYK